MSQIPSPGNLVLPEMSQIPPPGNLILPERPPKPARKPKHIWSPAEDAVLIRAKGSGVSWQSVSDRLPGRDVKSCRNRWDNLQKKGHAWTADEDAALERAIKECEAKRHEYWKAVAAFLPGRTWQQTERRAEEKRAAK